MAYSLYLVSTCPHIGRAIYSSPTVMIGLITVHETTSSIISTEDLNQSIVLSGVAHTTVKNEGTKTADVSSGSNLNPGSPIGVTNDAHSYTAVGEGHARDSDTGSTAAHGNHGKDDDDSLRKNDPHTQASTIFSPQTGSQTSDSVSGTQWRSGSNHTKNPDLIIGLLVGAVALIICVAILFLRRRKNNRLQSKTDKVNSGQLGEEGSIIDNSNYISRHDTIISTHSHVHSIYERISTRPYADGKEQIVLSCQPPSSHGDQIPQQQLLDQNERIIPMAQQEEKIRPCSFSESSLTPLPLNTPNQPSPLHHQLNISEISTEVRLQLQAMQQVMREENDNLQNTLSVMMAYIQTLDRTGNPILNEEQPPVYTARQ
ncbi:hypothetical protein K435DRAFT_973052 [Dendrothele bispora CBS 962.96]|uniref:Uncharacterized protein n=1 Tax=Dendrothele bispora (strain CBS 962.96) TaxID=1314807 RepID=A0A4S8KUW4_DENBC|nr:hypothetical protein K435DRAFT_973052 [Dendrothele bispora CBS 962.96]